MAFKTTQAALAARGFSPGGIDGNFGKKTLAAEMAFAAGKHIDSEIEARAKPLAPLMIAAGINTPLRVAHFVATICVESAGFTKDQENLHYTSPARLDKMYSAVNGLNDAAALIKAGPVATANRVYANRNGNGDVSSGDGYRFRGRGDSQLTGRENYRQMAAKIGVPLEVQPDLLLQPDISAKVSVQFWSDKSLNRFADLHDAFSIRIRWNGPRAEGLIDTRRIADKLLALSQD